MFWEGRRGNRFLCDQSEILGCSSALSSGHCWAPASSGESQKLLRLGCRREQTSPMERKGSHRAAVWCCLRLGPNRPADRFLWGQGNWQGKGLRVSSGLPGHVGSWARGFFSPSQVIGLVSGFFPGAQHHLGSSLCKRGEHCMGKTKANYESFSTHLSFQEVIVGLWEGQPDQAV